MSDAMENARLAQIEQHLRILKDNDDEKTLLLLSIQASLIGSPLNGNRGLVPEFQNLDKRLRKLEQNDLEVATYLKQIKVIIIGIVLAIITLIVDLIKK